MLSLETLEAVAIDGWLGVSAVTVVAQVMTALLGNIINRFAPTILDIASMFRTIVHMNQSPIATFVLDATMSWTDTIAKTASLWTKVKETCAHWSCL